MLRRNYSGMHCDWRDLLCGRILPSDLYDRYATAMAIAVAFFVGYVLLPNWAPLVPVRHWQWLPYLAIASSVIGSVGFAAGVWRGERLLLFVLLSIAVATLLVPHWERLQSQRLAWVVALASYLFALISFLEPLAARFSAARLLGLLFLVAVCNTLAIAMGVLKYAQPKRTTCSGLVWLLALEQIVCRRLVVPCRHPIVITLVGGWPSLVPLNLASWRLILLVVPAAPLLLWVFAIKRRYQDRTIISPHCRQPSCWHQ